MKQIKFFLIFVGTFVEVRAQSFEVMPGTERLFVDAQYLKFFPENGKLSLFSRARATAGYNEQSTDLFTGAYLNYTTTSGFGGTVLGRISSRSSGVDAGIHYFKATKQFMVYALPSVNVSEDLLYSWFSIIRYTPQLKDDWNMYSSFELFSAFGEVGHLNSVQRLRLGLNHKGNQFGFAVNINSPRTAETDINPGLFLRKAF